MKLTIDIPIGYERDFNVDKFKDFFSRVIADINCHGLCGNYEKENLEKFKEWVDSDRSKRVTFVEAPKIFKDQVGADKVILIPTNDETIKPIRVIFEGE